MHPVGGLSDGLAIAVKGSFNAASKLPVLNASVKASFTVSAATPPTLTISGPTPTLKLPTR